MFGHACLYFLIICAVSGYTTYLTKNFKVGIEYEGSLPMSGAADRLKHRNNYEPFFVTITATAKSGYVISYVEVSATVALDGEMEFTVVRGQTGDKSIVFHLVSNHSDFLSYSYLAYGIREEEYKKVANIITIPMRNSSQRLYFNNILFTTICMYIAKYIFYM
ncbi:unnamed protein product [Pieris brassicae]|uniref:Uncharacterized protein n=1 Tax=Pieris brassicae TaxID=7116 RepID=A0A9P0XBB3_PIEBR|nr:unnamed protein product [Pieris brassicae]